MSEEMPPSWRSLASAASRSVKGYIAQQRATKQGYPASRGPPSPLPNGEQSKKQTWSQWAGQKLRRGSQGEQDYSGDRLSLFPGWAARRYRVPLKKSVDDAPFDVDIFVSGFASKLTGVNFNTRGGRTFLRMAKSFAALPDLPTDILSDAPLTPVRDQEVDEMDVNILDDRLRELELDARASTYGEGYPRTPRSHGSRTPSSASGASSSFAQSTAESATSYAPSRGDSDIHRWHLNLETRLHPFWSSVLSNRTVRVSLYATNPNLYDDDGFNTDSTGSSESSVSPEKKPIVSREVVTGVDGSFQLKLSVPWESLCVHPAGVHIAFGGSGLEHDLFVVAELLAPSVASPPTPQTPYQAYQPRQPRNSATVPPPAPIPTVTVAVSIPVPLTYTSVRVISDIDDTVKMSGILTGVRSVFRNVFVRDLRDSVIRGMGEWYMGMWKRGVRFHYVSNSPFELLPVINEFLQISQLPPGSIRLRSYGGRSLFSGLLSAPAMRKRAGVFDVLNHFPDARFLLVGDSGEQDLELYAEVARARPEQILAIFIRDAGARGDGAPPPLDDPTGTGAIELARPGASRPGTPSSGTSPAVLTSLSRRAPTRPPARSMSEATPESPPPLPRKPLRSFSGTQMPATTPSGPSSGDYFGTGSPSQATIIEEPREGPAMLMSSSAPSTQAEAWPPRGFGRTPTSAGSQSDYGDTPTSSWPPGPLPQARGTSAYGQNAPPTDAERRRVDLQMRLWRARPEVPPHIPIRIFREPEECVEVEHILDHLQVAQ